MTRVEQREAGSAGEGARRTRAAGVGVVALMALASVLLCPVSPLFWIWLGSQLQESSQPSLGPYLLVLGGIVASTVALGKALSVLGRLHARLTGSAETKRIRLPWYRSMRGERDSGRRTELLDVVMVTSVSVALLALAIWFFALAGSSLPK